MAGILGYEWAEGNGYNQMAQELDGTTSVSV